MPFVESLRKFILSQICILIVGIMLVTSCSFNVPSDTKVYIVALGIGYQRDSLHLEGSVRDVAEFAAYYQHILNTKGIKNEAYYMLNWGEYQSTDSTDWSSPYAPTRSKFESVIAKIASSASKNDLVVFLYSGHGLSMQLIPDMTPNTLDNGAFVLYDDDGDMGDLNNRDGLLTHQDFAAVMRTLPCHVVAIVDSCFSGHLISAVNNGHIGQAVDGDPLDDYGGIAKYVPSFESLIKVPSITAFVASTATQSSWDSATASFNGETHGLFLGNVLKDFGWEHNSETLFTTIPAYDSSKDGNTSDSSSPFGEHSITHSSLNVPYEVYGTAPDKSTIINTRYTTNDIKLHTYTVKSVSEDGDKVVTVKQKALRSIGPCNVILAW